MDSRQRFRDQLKRNIGFIRRSCELFAQGHQEEGIRIATPLRVLLHDTKNSTSLLKHLKVKDSMKLNSSCRIVPRGMNSGFFEGMGRLTLHVNGREVYRRLDPVLDDAAHPHIPISVQQWWEMPVYVRDAAIPDGGGGYKTELTYLERKDIILAAANKDGGAHVDEKLQPDYERLAASGAAWMYTNRIRLADGTIAVLPPLENAHLIYLRQMGYEVLSSFDMRLLLVIP
jgi:hypothetical protein